MKKPLPVESVLTEEKPAPKPAVMVPGRRCPSCLGLLKYVLPSLRKTKYEKSSQERLCECVNALNCRWNGPYYLTLPLTLSNIVKSDVDYKEAYLKLFQLVVNQQLSGEFALAELERYLQNHPNADPDSRGHREISRYIKKLSQLRLLSGLIDIVGMGAYKDHLMVREIQYLFPLGDNLSVVKR